MQGPGRGNGEKRKRRLPAPAGPRGEGGPARGEKEVRLHLCRVLGLTASVSGFAASPSDPDVCAYAAGGVVVVYNFATGVQQCFLSAASSEHVPHATSLAGGGGGSGGGGGGGSAARESHATPSSSGLHSVYGLGSGDDGGSRFRRSGEAPKPVSCLAWSSNGRHLAFGEIGHKPRILIADVQERTVVRTICGHKFAVSALAFSPNNQYLASLGFQHDGTLCVWNWKTGAKVASNKVSARVHSLRFSGTGSCVVTAGQRHVKFWYPGFPAERRSWAPQGHGQAAAHVLEGRSAVLGELRDNTFVDAAFEAGKSENVYCVTAAGQLCMFTESRVLEKWVDLNAKRASSVSVTHNYVACGCSTGIIRLFEPSSLRHLCTLPQAPALDKDATSSTSAGGPHTGGCSYSDVVALTSSASGHRLLALYADRTVVVWNMEDHARIKPVGILSHHSGSVWGVQTSCSDESLGDFASCSADGTIRFWTLARNPAGQGPSPGRVPDGAAAWILPDDAEGGYELTKIVYADRDSFRRDNQQLGQFSPLTATLPKNDAAATEAIRTFSISNDGRYLAAGSVSGGLRVYGLPECNLMVHMEGHDSEILSIDFLTEHPSCYLLATAGRDRVIRIFDVSRQFKLREVIDDHSATITAVRLSQDRLVSGGADRTVIFRKLCDMTNAANSPYVDYHSAVTKSSILDIYLDAQCRRVTAVTADRQIITYDLDTGKTLKTHRVDQDDNSRSPAGEGGLLRITPDPAAVASRARFAAVAADKSVRLVDASNGVTLAMAAGHSEMVTGVCFAAAGRFLVSSCADGCLYVWRIEGGAGCRAGSAATARGMEKASSGYRQQVRPAESGVGADAFEIRRPDERPEHRRPVAPDSSLSAAHTREEATETDARPPGFKRAYQTGHSSFLPEFTEQISLGVAASPAGQDMAAGTTGNFAPVSGKWAQRVDQVGVVLYSGESSSAAGHLARTGDLASRQQWHSLSPVTPAPAESPVMPEGPVTPPSASRKRSVSAPDGGGEAGPYVFVKAPPPARARDDRGRVASNAEIPRSPHPGGPAAKPAWTRATAREPPPVRAGIAPHERLLPGRISVVPRDQGNFGDDAEPGSTSAVVIEEYCRPDTFGCRVAGGEAPFQPFLKDAYARRNPTQPPASTAHLGTAKYDGGALPGAAAQGAGFQGAAGRRRQGELHVAAPPDTGANRRWSHTRDNNIAIVSTSPHEIYSARGFDTVQIRRELSDLQGLVSSLVDAYNAAALLPDPDNDQSELLDQMRACFRGVRAELDEVAGQQREVALRSTGDENRRASDEAVANARSGICGVDARDLLETYSDILVGMVEGKMKVVA